jgi:hypothetical protein
MIVDFSRNKGGKDCGSHPNHCDPADRTVDSAERIHDLDRRRYIELESAVTSRREHSENTDRSQLFHQIKRNPARGFDLHGACRDFGGQRLNIGKYAIGCICRGIICV